MNDDQCIIYAVEGGVARITLNRPDQRNAISLAVHRRMDEVLSDIEARDDVRAVLLTGEGKAFCSGQDLSERKVEECSGEQLGEAVRESVGSRYNPLVRRLLALPVPLVCAVNGVAAGAGASLALMADIVIAAESARFAYVFSKIGLMPDCGGSWILPHLAGNARALGIALTGDPISARQALDWGLIWKVVPDAELAAEAWAMASQLANAPTKALVATRDAIRSSHERSFDAQLDLELEQQALLAASDDYREGVSAFKEKRQPVFRGR